MLKGEVLNGVCFLGRFVIFRNSVANNNEQIYTFLTDDSGEERACEAIPESSCRESPGNFVKNMLSGASSKLAEKLISPALVIPWVFTAIGVPSSFSALLVPVKDAGSLLPQIFVSAQIRAYAQRKWFWVVPSLLQGLIGFVMAWAVSTLEGWTAGAAMIGLLAIYSILSGVASVAFKDVLAKTIDKGKRGQLLGMRSTVAGVLSLMAGVALYFLVIGESNRSTYVAVFAMGGVLWLLASFFFSRIVEYDGATEGGRNPVNEVKKGWRLMRTEPLLRNFIFTRALLMAVPLSLPLIIVIGQEYAGNQVEGLGLMVVASGIAGIVSSPFWGRFADRSSRRMMQWVALLGIVNIMLVLSFAYWPENLQNLYWFAPLYLMQVMAHGGARLSRKTYLVDMAPDDERPLYVSLSNTMIGLFTLLAGLIGFLVGLLGTAWILGFFALTLLAAIGLAQRLKEM